MAAASSNQTLTLHIPKSKQALIVGKGGATIKSLQDEYGCRIALPPADNASREVTIRGPHAAVAQLCSRLESVIGIRVGTVPLSIGRFSVPCATHGALLGKAGAKLRELEQRFNVEISIPRREANVDEVCAEGESAQLKLLQVELSALVLRNVSLVIEAIYASASDDALANEASLPRSPSTAPLPYRDLLLQVPRGKHSLIIGKGGATIRSLQDEFSCQVTISGGEQSSSRQVKISGTAANVSAAHAKIESLITMRVGTAPLSLGCFAVPCATHGALVGKAGAKLHELEQRFNVEISIPRREANVDEVCAEGDSAQLYLLQAELSKLLQQSVPLRVELLVCMPPADASQSAGSGTANASAAAAAERPPLIAKRPLLDLATIALDEAIFFGPDIHQRGREFSIDRFCDVLRSSRRSLDISIFSFSDDQIANIVEDAHNRGVAVRLISDYKTVSDQGSDVARLAKIGIPVKVDTLEGHMHNKFVVIDSRVTMSGSFNWTTAATRDNFEHVTISSSAKLATQFSAYFESMWTSKNFQFLLQ